MRSSLRACLRFNADATKKHKKAARHVCDGGSLLICMQSLTEMRAQRFQAS
jgi:hypothetical protein